MAAKSGAKSIVMNSKKKIEKLQKKAIKIIKFLLNDAPVTKTMKGLKILKLKLYYTLKHSFCEIFTDKGNDKF